MSLSGLDQRYNNANRGIVDKGRINYVPHMYRHESNNQSRNFITFLKLKNTKFGKTNFLVIYLSNNYEFSYEIWVMNYEWKTHNPYPITHNYGKPITQINNPKLIIHNQDQSINKLLW